MTRAVRISLLAAAVCGAALAESYLGIAVIGLTPERAQELHLRNGVEVVRVEPRSPADEAGLKPHDVVLAFGSQSIERPADLGQLVSTTPIGKRVHLVYWRDGVYRRIEVSPAARPEAGIQPFFPPFDPLVDHPDLVYVWRNDLIGIVGESVAGGFAASFGTDHGVFVRDLRPGAPAYKAGLQIGDVIAAAGERPVFSTRDITAALSAEQTYPKKSVRLAVIRDHKHLNLDLTIVAE